MGTRSRGIQALTSVVVMAIALALFAIFAGFVSSAAFAAGTWTPQSSGTTDHLGGVFFRDANHGWAVGGTYENGTILATTDGGTNWTSQTSGVTDILDSVFFLTTKCGWATGYDRWGGSVILKTTNAGKDWSAQEFNYGYSSLQILSVGFSDASDGWAAGYAYNVFSHHYQIVTYATSDGGAHWNPQWSDVPGDSWNNPNSIFFADATDGWAAGVNGSLVATTAGGANWVAQTPGTAPPQLDAVYFADTTRGWAVGDGDTILGTTDGGAHWNAETPGTEPIALLSVRFADATHGWAVGYDSTDTGNHGIIRATTDGGASWTPQAVDTPYNLNSVDFPYFGRGWTVGNGGIIYAYSDGTPTPSHTVTASCSSGGSISPAGPQSVSIGDDITFTLTPDSGYRAVDLVVDGVSLGPKRSYTFTDVTADRTISAAFAQVPTIVLIGGLDSKYGDNGKGEGQTWQGVYDYLHSRGYRVLVPPMTKGSSSDEVMDSQGGYLYDNWKRLDNWLAAPAQKVAPNTPVVLVGHSMGGLIARGFAESSFKPFNVKVVGIYQIDTPNLGSPQSAIGRWVDESVSVEELDARGTTIGWFNSQVAPKTSILTRHVESDFFPLWAASHMAPWWNTPVQLWQVATIDAMGAAFGLGVQDDGMVSEESATFTPPGRDGGSLLVHALHGDGLGWLGWPGSDYLPPVTGTSTGNAVLSDLAAFIAEAAANGTTSTKKPSSGTMMASTVPLSRSVHATLESDTPSPTDVDSACGWKTIAEDETGLAPGSTISVPFSVEATGALISASADAGTPTISVVDSTGSSVDCEATSTSGRTMGAVSCAPGQYVAYVGLSGADAASASISVSDAGPSELRVDAPSQAPAGSDFTVEAGVYENGVRQTGGVFSASVGGDTVALHDDGLAPDSVAGDGVSSGTLTAPASGTADVVVRASGTDAEDVAFTRIAHEQVSIAVPRATLSGPFTWHTTTGTSGKADALLFDVGVHASQDCTLQVAGTVTSDGGTVAQPSTVVTLAAGTDTTVTLRVTPGELENVDSSGDFSFSSVNLLDMTDGALTCIDSATPALSGTLAPSDVEYAACSVGLVGSAPTAAATVDLTGEVVCTTAAIAGVELSFDDGAIWQQAPAPAAGWGSHDETWSAAYALPEGDYGVISQALDADGDPIAGAKGQCTFTVDRTAPTTTATIDPSGWSRQATVALATDDGTGSGAAHTLYSINGGPEQVYAGPFTVATEGAQVTFSSTDMAGNREATQTVSPKVDITSPVTTDNAGSAWHAGPWSLALTATDPLAPDGSHSGMSGGSAGTQYSLDNGASWQSGATVAFPRWKRGGGSGTYGVRYRSTDAVGNTEQTESTTVRIDNSLPTSDAALTVAANPATVALTASDPDSGVACLWYSLDGGAWQRAVYPGPAGVPVTIAGLGAHTLCYYAVDVVGNLQAGYRVATVTNTAAGPTLVPAVARHHRVPRITRAHRVPAVKRK